MADQIWITGLGVASSIGLNVGESLDSLMTGTRGIGPIKILDTIHKDDFRVGEIGFTDQHLMEILGIPVSQYELYTRTTLIGMIAAREAIVSAGIDPSDGVPTALISATTVGGMDKSEREFGRDDADPAYIRTHPCGDSTNKIAAFVGVDGYRTTLSTACSSSANAIIHGARLIRHAYVERAIVGGVDALSKFTLNGFNSLMILDRDDCRPFDRHRRGLNLGEGAGFLVLESDRSLAGSKRKKICSLSGFSNANDAHHQTASSPDGQGAFDAMTKALDMSGIVPEEVDYINAHGTGTENNDASEGAALLRVFGETLPPFSSTKSYTGHTLGAAAGIEAVFSVLALMKGVLYPGLGFREPMEGIALSPIRKLQRKELGHVLSNSFGFGGNNSTLIFSKP